MDIQALLSFGDNSIGRSDRIATEVSAAISEAESRLEFVSSAIAVWNRNPKREMMDTAHRYYNGQTDILCRKRQVIGRNGEMIDAPYLANNRLPHAFMRKLTNQKIGYLLSKPFALTSDSEEFQQIVVNDYLDAAFYSMFKNAGKEAIICGISWLQVYYDEKGTLRFKRIPSQEVIPFWKDIDHTVLDSLIRVYAEKVYSGDDVTVVLHAKLYTPEGVYNYVQDKNGFIVDTSMPKEGNFTIRTSSIARDDAGLEPPEEGTSLADGAGFEAFMWARIPFIQLRYNTEENSLLTFIKPLIDDYDRRTSDTSNVIEEEPDRIKVVKDYDGTDKGEFVFNLARYRTLFLRGTGEVSTLDTSINVDAIQSHLERLRQDIYEFGGGVDTQNKDLGNASGVALKFIYSDLDMDCGDFGSELSWAVQQLCWFIKQDQLLRFGKNFSDARIQVTFNTDVTINETETVTNLQNSVGILSTRTLLEQHPYVTDVAAELDRLQEDASREVELTASETAE